MSTIYIPDTLRNWRWQRSANPHLDQCRIESSAWAESFRAFSPKAQAAFNNCDFSLLASLVYPKLNKDGCRVGCDLMNVFFIFDEWSDVSTAEETRVLADIIMDALRNQYTPRPKGEWVGGELTRQFWENAIRIATPIAQRRFIETFEEYTDAVVQQSEDRGKKHVRTVEDFFELRRKTIGAKPSFVINELHMSIPDYVMQNEVIQRLQSSCVDMICIGNDLYSYNVEQSRGDSLHNLVTIAMSQYQLDEQGAFNWLGELHDQLAEKFMEDFRKLPSWGAGVDEEVAMYVDDLGNWIRANEQWSFQSQRYFSTDGLRVLKERTNMLLPKRESSSVKPNQQGIAVFSLSSFKDTMSWFILNLGTFRLQWIFATLAAILKTLSSYLCVLRARK